MASFCAKGTHTRIYICMYLWIRSSIITHSRVPSRPIMGYLVSKYAKNDSLYPKDPKRRGIVDQMLYFDIGTLNENVVKCYVRIFSFPFYAFEGHFSEPSWFFYSTRRYFWGRTPWTRKTYEPWRDRARCWTRISASASTLPAIRSPLPILPSTPPSASCWQVFSSDTRDIIIFLHPIYLTWLPFPII